EKDKRSFEALSAIVYRPENLQAVDHHHRQIMEKTCVISAMEDNLQTIKTYVVNAAKKETVVKTPGLSSPCTMECGEGLLTAFGVGFTPHIQRQARTDLRVRAYAIDVALHLTVAPVTAFHGIGGGGQQPIIEKRQGFFQCGRIELLQRVTQEWEAPKTPPQLPQFVESGLGPTAPIEQRIHLVHDCPERV